VVLELDELGETAPPVAADIPLGVDEPVPAISACVYVTLGVICFPMKIPPITPTNNAMTAIATTSMGWTPCEGAVAPMSERAPSSFAPFLPAPGFVEVEPFESGFFATGFFAESPFLFEPFFTGFFSSASSSKKNSLLTDNYLLIFYRRDIGDYLLFAA